jgi:two-component system sensor histidine kinase HydH
LRTRKYLFLNSSEFREIFIKTGCRIAAKFGEKHAGDMKHTIRSKIIRKYHHFQEWTRSKSRFYFDKEGSYTAAAMLFLFISVSTLVFGLINNELSRAEAVVQIRTERSLAQLFYYIRNMPDMEGLTLEDLKMVFEDELLGMGIYDQKGELLASVGDVQDSVSDMEEQSRHRFLFGEMYYTTQFPLPPDPIRKIIEAANLPGFTTYPKYMQLVLKTEEYNKKERLMKLSFWTIEGSLLITLFLVFRLVRKNRMYQVTLSKQKNLVQLGQAARTISHEMKNPLSAIRLRVSILKRTVDAGEDLSVIEEEIERLDHLNNRIRDFLQNPEGEPVSIDVKGFIQEIIKRFPEGIVYTAETNAKVRMDEHRLRSVLENVIKNAIESGSDIDQVQVRVFVQKSRVHIEVEDQGSGIPEEMLKDVFSPFVSGKTQGTGIGLAIARNFLMAAGGKITIENTSQGGALVKMVLPEER